MNEIKKTFAAKTLLHFYGSDALEQSKPDRRKIDEGY